MLYGQVRWFIRLRWIAAATIAVGAVVDHYWLNLYGHFSEMLAVGAAIALYNGVLQVVLRSWPGRQWTNRSLLMLVWLQVVLDLAFLTLLATWTGGIRSPLVGFYVFHMVIASLLMQRAMAYTAAAVSWAALATALWYTRQWPAQWSGAFLLGGWLVTLLATVYLTCNITRDLHRQRDHLQRQRRRIRSITDELRKKNQSLMQQEKMVAMGQLAAGVAHEIANPLASMDSVLQLVQRKPARMRPDTIEKLREQVGRISEIVRQLTDYAHPGQAERSQVPLREILLRALGMVEFDRRLRNMDLQVDLDEPARQTIVSVQPQTMEQVLVNVILNSLDAVADGPEPRLTIRLGRQDRECFIEVADNGHGISAEHMHLLFEPFFTTKPVAKGTGLGLAISFKLVHRHGGRIEVTSAGKGATFKICLPVAG